MKTMLLAEMCPGNNLDEFQEETESALEYLRARPAIFCESRLDFTINARNAGMFSLFNVAVVNAAWSLMCAGF